MPPIDVEAVRKDTPGVDVVAHLNNAGASLPPLEVIETVIGHLRREATIGPYEAAAAAAPALDRTRESVGALLGARGDEIALTENASRAWGLAMSSIPLRPGDRIVTGQAEYGSNVVGLHRLRDQGGVEVVVIDDDADGLVDAEALSAVLDERVKAVCLTHVPGDNGLVNPIVEVGAAVRDHPARYVVDASQSIGQLGLDVEAIGCDFLVGASRKYLRGPRGVGILYARSATTAGLEPVLGELGTVHDVDGARAVPLEDARRFETWEASIAARLGLGAAVDLALTLGLDAIEERVTGLADGLRHRLGELDRVELRDRGRQRCGLVTFTVDGHPAAAVVDRLRERQINTWVALRSSSPFAAAGTGAAVRASVHYFNSEDEISQLVDVLEAVTDLTPVAP